MSKIILYIAASLDGKIAGPDGDVSWLEEFPSPSGSDFGYAEFYAGISTTIMGNETYKLVKSFDVPWPYPDKKNYVLTRNSELSSNEEVEFISGDLEATILKIKKDTKGDIWLVGGGQLNTLFLENGWLDELILTTMPIILGEGIPMFANIPPQTNLNCLSVIKYDNGATGNHYEVI